MERTIFGEMLSTVAIRLRPAKRSGVTLPISRQEPLNLSIPEIGKRTARVISKVEL